jgi:hypothetical protein
VPPIVPGASRSAWTLSRTGTLVLTLILALRPPALAVALWMHCAEHPAPESKDDGPPSPRVTSEAVRKYVERTDIRPSASVAVNLTT